MGKVQGDGRKARWAAHRESRRAELVAAAVAAIARHGPGLGMDDIAAAAGVTKPVVYRHFADRADLYVAVGQRVAADLLAELTRELDVERHPQASLAAVIGAYLAAIERDPNLYSFVVRRPVSDTPPARDVVADFEGQIAAAIARNLGEWLRAAGLDSGAAEPWAYGVVGHVRAAGEWWLERRSMSRADLCAYLVAQLWGGFRTLYEQALAVPGSGLQTPAPPAGSART